MSPRLREKYQKEVVPALKKEFGYANVMAIPKIEKVVINMGLGAAVGNPKIIDSAVEDMRALSGQKPVVTRARKSIATFKKRSSIRNWLSASARRLACTSSGALKAELSTRCWTTIASRHRCSKPFGRFIAEEVSSRVPALARRS